MSLLINEKEKIHYDKVMKATPPVQAGLNRVMVVQIREEDEVVECISIPGLPAQTLSKVGSILMPKETKEKMKSESETVKGVVKSVGLNVDGRTPFVAVGDLVMVFPSVFETKMTFDGIDYFVYSERDLVALETPLPIDMEEVHKMD